MKTLKRKIKMPKQEKDKTFQEKFEALKKTERKLKIIDFSHEECLKHLKEFRKLRNECRDYVHLAGMEYKTLKNSFYNLSDDES